MGYHQTTLPPISYHQTTNQQATTKQHTNQTQDEYHELDPAHPIFTTHLHQLLLLLGEGACELPHRLQVALPSGHLECSQGQLLPVQPQEVGRAAHRHLVELQDGGREGHGEESTGEEGRRRGGEWSIEEG